MPKRKRPFSPPPPGDDSRPQTSISTHRLTHKLTQPLTPLAQAFKLAKGFERQKLGRRHKTATAENKPDDVVRIDEEIAKLKELENRAVAQKVLGKRVRAVRAVQEKVAADGDVGGVLEAVFGPVGTGMGGEGKAELNIVARLVNSGPVGKVLGGCVDECLAALGVEGVKGGKKRLRKKDFEGMEDGKGAVGEKKGTGSSRKVVVDDKYEDEEVNGREETRGDAVSEDEFVGFDDRIASSSAEGSDDEDIGDLERQLEMEGIRQSGNGTGRSTMDYNPQDELSLSDEEMQDEFSASPSPEPRKSKSKAKTTAPPVKGSAFLPSLSMGGYISGSDSEAEDFDSAPPRKNRPGQRARQQIWEKKYGTRAKHLQKPDRKAGWDPKRGATDGSERRGGKGKFHHNSNGPRKDFAKPQASGPTAAVKKHRDDKGPIHPSWEAAKKAKEKRDAPVAFQGKKVVFD